MKQFPALGNPACARLPVAGDGATSGFAYNREMLITMPTVKFLERCAPPKMVQGTFPFSPSGGEGHEHDKVLAAAKAILQQAANEL